MKTTEVKKSMGILFIGILLACTMLGVAGIWGAIEGDTAWQIFYTLVVCAVGLGTASMMMDNFFKVLIVAVSLAIPSLAYSQEAWIDDVEVINEPAYVDPVLQKLEAIERDIASLKAAKMQAPAACSCDCDCPTIDEIRNVVREELDRVTITLKTAAGVEKKVEMPLTKTNTPKMMQLQPGERVVAIDGVPVTPFTYQSQAYNAPVTQYQTPAYEMRVLNRSGSFFGAVRSNRQCVGGNCN